jgi:hypothetical protein
MTLETIEAVSVRPDGPEFATPGEAIAYARRMWNRTPHNDDLTTYLGRRITSIDCGDRELQLRLEEGTTLQFRVVDETIDLRVLGAETETPPPDSSMSDAVFIRLGEQHFLWERGDLVRSLRG